MSRVRKDVEQACDKSLFPTRSLHQRMISPHICNSEGLVSVAGGIVIESMCRHMQMTTQGGSVSHVA